MHDVYYLSSFQAVLFVLKAIYKQRATPMKDSILVIELLSIMTSQCRHKSIVCYISGLQGYICGFSLTCHHVTALFVENKGLHCIEWRLLLVVM